MCASGHEIGEYLQEHNTRERDRLATIEDLIERPVQLWLAGEGNIMQGQGGSIEDLVEILKGHEYVGGSQASVDLHVDEERALREEHDEHAQEEVRVQKKLPVDQVVVSGPRRTLEQIALLLLHHERQAGRDVGEQRDDEHLKRGQVLRHADQHGHEHGHELGEAAARQQVQDHLAQVGEDEAAGADGDQDGGEVVVEEHKLTGLHGHLAARAHGDADVGALERRRVVHAVARHAHHEVRPLELFDDEQLLFGRGARKHHLLVLGDHRPLALGHVRQVRAAEQQRRALALARASIPIS